MEKVAVYLYGMIGRHNYWYRIELQMPTTTRTKTNTGKRKRISKRIIRSLTREEISPVAIMYDAYVGCWAVIDDTIYCIGGVKYEGRASTLITDLLKYNLKQHSDDPSIWEIESSKWNKPRELPFVAAIDTNKLCVISGHRYIPYKVDFSEYYYHSDSDVDEMEMEKEKEKEKDDDEEDDEDEDDDEEDEDEDEDDKDEDAVNKFFKLLNCEKRYKEDEAKCGEFYDVGTQRWKLLDAKYSHFKMFRVFNQSAVVENDGEQPTQIVSYALTHGIIHVFDVTSGTSKPPECHKDLALLSFDHKDTLPRGLTDPDDFGALQLVARNVAAVFANGIFYWFSHTLRLYGYDTHAKTWLLSRSLEGELPSVIFDFLYDQRYPILLHLPNGKFLLTIHVDYGEVTMAFLTVHKAASCLDVSVDLVQSFKFSDESFMPTDGKAVLLNNTR